MQKIFKLFSKEEKATLEANSRQSIQISLPTDTLIDIFRFLPRKVLCQRIQTTNSLIFRLCNSEKVPNIHRIQLILTHSSDPANYPYERPICNVSECKVHSRRRFNNIFRCKIFGSRHCSCKPYIGRYIILLNPTQAPLDLVTFSQLPPVSRNIRISRLAIRIGLTVDLVYLLSKVKHMFEGCRLEIKNQFGYTNTSQILQLLDKTQIKELAICPTYSDNYISGHAFRRMTSMLEVIDTLEMLSYPWNWEWFKHQQYRCWSHNLPQVLLGWLHCKGGDIEARKHMVFQRCGRENISIDEMLIFLDSVIQIFQSAELPCNFMVSWSVSDYEVSSRANLPEPIDLFNGITKERLSFFERENEPNIFRLWRRQSSLDDFHKLLPYASNKTIHENVWKDPFYYHRFTEILHKTADIPTLPLGCSTKRRQQRFKILCQSRRTADSNDN